MDGHVPKEDVGWSTPLGGADVTQEHAIQPKSEYSPTHPTLQTAMNFGPPPPPALETSPVQISRSFPTSAASRTMSSPIASSLGNTCMQPTWRGFIHTTRDGLTILEACLQGYLSHIPRRPHDRERQSIISSGNIFVYEENASGIRRWTDGITWSPSRIMGNFLVYRELRDGHQPGEKKRAAKKRKRGNEEAPAPQEGPGGSEDDRQLIGSLSLDAYNFKPGGLAKKTLSVEFRGVRHHIISYYRVEDIKEGLYHRPTQDEFLNTLEPRAELAENPGFKFPVEDRDDKVKIVVPPQAQMQTPHPLQMVNAGLPVVVNVPARPPMHQHSHSMPQVTSQPAQMMYRPTVPENYQIPQGSLDPFDSDPALQDLQSAHPNSNAQRLPVQHPQTPVSLQSSPQPSQHIIRRDPPIKRMRRDSSQHSNQFLYFDSSYVPPTFDFGLSHVSSAPAKYFDDIAPDHGYFGSMPMGDFTHQPLYMLPQEQSYGG